jgi:predicted DCC family thiol-disulfide oxidoreductase YuxK
LNNKEFIVKFEVFFDGDCPLCIREVNLLRWLDRHRGAIQFTDITDDSFDAVSETGLSNDELMAEIYGRLPSGEMVKGMEVFRQLYSAVGLGFVFAPTAWPGLRPGFDKLYSAFAKNRLRLTGRCTDDRCAIEA